MWNKEELGGKGISWVFGHVKLGCQTTILCQALKDNYKRCIKHNDFLSDLDEKIQIVRQIDSLINSNQNHSFLNLSFFRSPPFFKLEFVSLSFQDVTLFYLQT